MVLCAPDVCDCWTFRTSSNTCSTDKMEAHPKECSQSSFRMKKSALLLAISRTGHRMAEAIHLTKGLHGAVSPLRLRLPRASSDTDLAHSSRARRVTCFCSGRMRFAPPISSRPTRKKQFSRFADSLVKRSDCV